MTAARGFIHSEMPQQTEGRMRGFQIWLNLPAKEKMKPAAYRDIKAASIPVVSAGSGVEVKVIAGELDGRIGPIHGLSTAPLIFDVHLAPGALFEAPVAAGHNAFLYAYEGEALVGPDRKALPHRAAGLLSDGEGVRLEAGAQGARVLLLAARPIGEPIVQYGPFVMNSREEIEQAIQDYQSGELTRERVRRVETA
jgi:redox-sensitive bicupin YhaK (pirin superfamily)